MRYTLLAIALSLPAGLAATTLLGCNTAQKQRCEEVFTALCEHQAECGVYPDVQSCKENLQNTLVCDPAAADAAYGNCKARSAAAECDEVFPTECGDVLCPAGGGCADITGEHTAPEPIDTNLGGSEDTATTLLP